MAIKKLYCDKHRMHYMPWQRCWGCIKDRPNRRPITDRLPSEPDKALVRQDMARMAAGIKKKIGECQCCGWAAPKDVFGTNKLLNIHHVKRVADGGTNEWRNLAVLCPNCHAIAHAIAGGRVKRIDQEEIKTGKQLIHALRWVINNCDATTKKA